MSLDLRFRLFGAFRRLKAETIRGVFRTFGSALQGQGLYVASAVVLAVATSCFELLRPWPIKYVFDHVLATSKKHAGAVGPRPFGWSRDEILIAACVGIIGTSILIALCSYVQSVAAAQAGRKASTRVRRRVFEHLHRLGMPFHNSSRSGDLLTRLIGDVSMVRDLLLTSWLNVGGKACVFFGTAFLMVVLDPMLGLIAMSPFPILALGVRRSSKKLKDVTRKQRKMEGESASFAAETLRQIRLVKAYSAIERATQAFARDSRSGERAGVEATRITAGVGSFSELVTGAGLAALLFFGVKRVHDAFLTPGDLVILISYARSLYKPLRGLSKEGIRMAKAAASADRVLDLLKLPIEDDVSGAEAPAFAGAVRFENVEAEYLPTVRALRGLNLDIRAGELAVINGPNGAGKSTTIAVLLRLIDPVKGRVLIDGRPVTDWRLSSYRDRIAYVPQDTQLFGSTVRDNLLYGKPDATDEQIEAAARAALAHDFISRLPQGYDTVLGEGGATISGGEARRLMLARAALRDARVLLLDEPLTGLDPDARSVVAQAIRSIAAGRTTIVVTHVSADEIDPDLVLELADGRLRRETTRALTGRDA